MNIEVKHGLAVDALRASPAAAAGAIGFFTASELIAWVTLVYLIGLAGYTYRRWWRAERKWRRNDRFGVSDEPRESARGDLDS